MIKKGARRAPFFIFDLATLDWSYVFSLGTFLAISDVELNLLAISQSFEAVALNRAEMYEHIGAIFTLDKAKSFGFVEPLYCTICLRHTVYLYSERHHYVQVPSHLVFIYGVRTDDHMRTSIVRINTAELIQLTLV